MQSKISVRIVAIATVVASVMVLIGAAGSSPQQASAAPTASCGISSGTPSGYESRTLIVFPGGTSDPSNFWMSSKTSLNRKAQETVNTSLSAGTYKVVLYAFDDHSENPNDPAQIQPHEQYYLELKNSSGSIIARTGASDDIAPNEQYTRTRANEALVIGSDIKKITPVHAAYPDNSSINSVTAVCAAFDKIKTSVSDPILNITKQVRNITQNSAEAVTVPANPSDTVEFVIRVSNSGAGNATNVIVSDTLPSRLAYISSSTTVDGSSWANGITTGGINVGILVPNQTKIIRFRTIVADATQFSNGTTILTNTGTASADNVGAVSDQATVSVTITAPPTLVCDPSNQTVSQNQNASFSATGGTGTYAWSATGGNPSSGSGASFITKYATAGTKTVTVTSGTQSDSCTVSVLVTEYPDLSITKRVRNLTQSSSEAVSVSAAPSDTVEFIIRITNTGIAPAVDTIASDTLPSRLAYVNGSTTVDGAVFNNGITGGGINIGIVTPSQTRIIKFRASVADENQFNVGTTTLINYGFASADGVAQVSDNASVNVIKSAPPELICSPSSQTIIVNQNASFSATGGTGTYAWSATGGNPSSGSGAAFSTLYTTTGTKTAMVSSGTQTKSCTVVVNPNATDDPLLSMSKRVLNVTQNSGETVTVSANPSDIVEFVIRVTNSGTGNATNVIVSDVLPSKLAYINGSTTIDGIFKNDGITTSNINIGTVGVNQTRTIRFRTQVADQSQFSNGTTTLTNTASVRADGTSTINDSAHVTVTKSPGTSSLSITKRVSNITRGYAESTSVNANPSDMVEYVIRVTNTGTVNATNVIVSDTLPSNISYNAGSSTVDGNFQSDGVTSGGINIGTMSSGQVKTIRFRAQVAGTGSFGSGTVTLTNYGYARADSISQISDVAYVVVNIQNSLTCSPANQSATVNNLAYFSASNGSGTYYWNANNGNPATGNGSSFSTRFSSNGTYTVSVSDSIGGYATCSVTVNGGGNSTLSIDKTVRNITQNSAELNSVNANLNDTLEFILRVTVNSSNYANNIRVWDTLPASLRYVSGSTTVDGTYRNDGITTGGITIGSYSGYRAIVVRFQVQIDNGLGNPIYSANITNTGYASADNIGQVSDQAFVIVTTGGCTTNCSYQLSVQKLGRNISKADSTNHTNVIANPSDTIEFTVTVQNTSSSTINNVMVRDVLPGGLSYINRTTSLNGIQIADGIVSGGINIGTLAPHQIATIRYDAVANDKNYFAKGTTKLINYAYARADGTSEVSSQLPISIVNGSIIHYVSKIPTGANETAVALLIAGLATMFYLAYAHTGLFKVRNAQAVMARMQRDLNKFNFR